MPVFDAKTHASYQALIDNIISEIRRLFDPIKMHIQAKEAWKLLLGVKEMVRISDQYQDAITRLSKGENISNPGYDARLGIFRIFFRDRPFQREHLSFHVNGFIDQPAHADGFSALLKSTCETLDLLYFIAKTAGPYDRATKIGPWDSIGKRDQAIQTFVGLIKESDVGCLAARLQPALDFVTSCGSRGALTKDYTTLELEKGLPADADDLATAKHFLQSAESVVGHLITFPAGWDTGNPGQVTRPFKSYDVYKTIAAMLMDDDDIHTMWCNYFKAALTGAVVKANTRIGRLCIALPADEYSVQQTAFAISVMLSAELPEHPMPMKKIVVMTDDGVRYQIPITAQQLEKLETFLDTPLKREIGEISKSLEHCSQVDCIMMANLVDSRETLFLRFHFSRASSGYLMNTINHIKAFLKQHTPDNQGLGISKARVGFNHSGCHFLLTKEQCAILATHPCIFVTPSLSDSVFELFKIRLKQKEAELPAANHATAASTARLFVRKKRSGEPLTAPKPPKKPY